MATSTALPVSDAIKAEAIQKRVDEWLQSKGWTPYQFCTPQEWNERGEIFGRNALLTLVFEESPLYEYLNCPSTKWEFEVYDEFHALCSDLGCHVELGYSWSAHWYEV